MRALAAVLTSAFITSFAFAQTTLDGDQQARVKALYDELRCVVCQNQAIGDSDADVAKDLRAIVAEQIAAGKTDAQVKQFLVDRYGEFILLKPLVAWHTLILWITPAVLLLVAMGFAWSRRSKVDPQTAAFLTADEERRVAELIDKK